ncbi:YkyB family protein [Sporosarcina thermotolerans]|nr:YkyB family protein [Sporosarcina thermotolerans]WHT46877.1 YkyB family protein [Sporosarcina thermotolerans]
METESNIRQIAIAIYTVNRHAKTAPNNRVLYELKNSSIRKLLRLGYAQKIGLHFIENPQLSKQSSTVLVKCGDFLFIPYLKKKTSNLFPI